MPLVVFIYSREKLCDIYFMCGSYILHKNFMGVFAKLRKETIIFIMSVRLFVCVSVRPDSRPDACDKLTDLY